MRVRADPIRRGRRAEKRYSTKQTMVRRWEWKAVKGVNVSSPWREVENVAALPHHSDTISYCSPDVHPDFLALVPLAHGRGEAI
jgi:hypothetical protein